MGARERRKGQAGEREVVQLLREHLGVEVERELGQSRDGGADVALEVGGKAMALEIKRQERAVVTKWLDQVMAVDADLHTVLWRPSRREWCAVVPLETWLYLLREAGVQ